MSKNLLAITEHARISKDEVKGGGAEIPVRNVYFCTFPKLAYILNRIFVTNDLNVCGVWICYAVTYIHRFDK